MNQKFIKFDSSILITILAAIIMPVMANAEPHPELQTDNKIVNFIKAVGLPKSLNEVKSGSTNLAIWNYPHSVNGKDMYILLEDGHPKSVTIDGKIVLSALHG